MPGAPERRRRVLLAGGAAAAVVVALGALVLSGRDGERDGSELVGRDAVVEITRTPRAYRIVYRVETGGDEVTVVTDEVASRRPWESRMDTREGEPPGGERFSARVGWFLHTATVTPGADASIIEVAPGVPPTDLRLDEVLPLALEHDLAERREVRRVAGRECQVYRTRRTLAAPIAPPAGDEHVDTCVDEAGLVLEEVVTVDGDILTRRVATEVSEQPDLDATVFHVEGESLPAAQGGGFVRRVKEGSLPPGEVFVTDTPPAGFDHAGRFSVVPAQPENFGDDPLRESFRRAGIVDVWVRGADVIALDQGGTLRGAEPFEPAEGAPKIDVAPFGQAELLLSGAGVEVRVNREGGRYLRLYGTVPPDELVALAASLRAVEGNTLELVDPDQP